jgi:hypothetical protein
MTAAVTASTICCVVLPVCPARLGRGIAGRAFKRGAAVVAMGGVATCCEDCIHQLAQYRVLPLYTIIETRAVILRDT